MSSAGFRLACGQDGCATEEANELASTVNRAESSFRRPALVGDQTAPPEDYR